ncbi:MAG: hypothetical protein P4L49_09950 [Desulfosporosinus sp.]|nr:hypothetical protein [Desulfosporosinus sp.]
MAAKIINFPTKLSQDEEKIEIEGHYETYYENEDLANVIEISRHWIPAEKHPVSNEGITVGFIQFIVLIITVVAILVLCFLKAHF